MKFFDILNDVIKDKSGKLLNDPNFKKEFNPYMIARFLSMRSDLIEYGQKVNQRASYLTNENLYRYLIKKIPKKNNAFIRYIKKPKDKKKKN